jgi:hypothetical protein
MNMNGKEVLVMYHEANMVEICMVGSIVFEVIALSMFLACENKVTVNGCKFCTLRSVLF